MGLRPARCYRTVKRPYTRVSQRKPRKGYVKAVPETKIHVFITGDRIKQFDKTFYLISKSHIQIRHNAFEAARIATSRFLDKTMGVNNYYLRFLVYPHHIMRENAMATGAGADRYQSGMRLAFGRPAGRAAQVKVDQRLIELRIVANFVPDAKKALKLASSKFPTVCQVIEGLPPIAQ